ncbi:MAG: IclR family transcriptional regulator [Desulfovibrionales bacterium]|nr:IclR family transcriptional regulator [Desulfovibrionales bacterium]
MATTDKYFMMRSLEKAMFIVETMATKKSWRLKALSEACSIPKGTLQRILLTFEELGYVSQLETKGAYSLTLKFHKIGNQILSQNNLGSLLQPLLVRLRDQVNETVNLSVLSGLDMVVISQVASSHALQMDSIVGTSFSAYLSASGKMFLAFVQEEKLRSFIKELRHSNADIKTEQINVLYNDLEKIRERGIGIDFEELFKGVRCIAAPIFDDSGKIIATISCSVPTVRLDKAFAKKLLQDISSTALEASKLFHAPESSFAFDLEKLSEQIVAPLK